MLEQPIAIQMSLSFTELLENLEENASPLLKLFETSSCFDLTPPY